MAGVDPIMNTLAARLEGLPEGSQITKNNLNLSISGRQLGQLLVQLDTAGITCLDTEKGIRTLVDKNRLTELIEKGQVSPVSRVPDATYALDTRSYVKTKDGYIELVTPEANLIISCKPEKLKNEIWSLHGFNSSKYGSRISGMDVRLANYTSRYLRITVKDDRVTIEAYTSKPLTSQEPALARLAFNYRTIINALSKN